MNETDLIRKIHGLIAKAESTTNEHEADAFFAKAQALMVQHAIDEQRVREADPRRKKMSAPKAFDFMYATNDDSAVGKAILLNQIALASSVQLIDFPNRPGGNLHRPGNKGKYSRWGCLVGFEEDVELVKYLYASLLLQGSRFASIDWKARNGASTTGRSRFMTAYLIAFGTRIGERFNEYKQKVASESFALIVLRDEEVKAAVEQRFPAGLVTSTTSAGADMIGRALGRRAGDKADIGNRRLPEQRPALNGG